MATLGINIDHIATIRQARGGIAPDPIHGAIVAEMAGAHGITAHLREDRRHMNDRDIRVLKETITTRLNLEMAATAEMKAIALATKPFSVTLVPEKREERTTEGGLAVSRMEHELTPFVRELVDAGILVSLFIAPDLHEVEASVRTGASHIEIHTGFYADAATETARAAEFARIAAMTACCRERGLRVNAGHGLNYQNVTPVAKLLGMEELNIGHSIIGRAVFVGLDRAVRDMLALIA